MHNYFFNQDIKITTVNDLVDRLQEVEGKINLFFSTNGEIGLGWKPIRSKIINYEKDKKANNE